MYSNNHTQVGKTELITISQTLYSTWEGSPVNENEKLVVA